MKTSYITDISHNTSTKCVLLIDEEIIDSAVTEQRSVIRTTDDIPEPEVGVYMSFTQMHRRGLVTSICKITCELHNASTKCVLTRALQRAKIEQYSVCADFVRYLLGLR